MDMLDLIGTDLYNGQDHQHRVVIIKLKTVLIWIFLSGIAAAIIAATVQIRNHIVNDSIQIDLIQRELRANAKFNRPSITNIHVYRSTNGSLVASWDDGDQICKDVPVLEPKGSSDLYRTIGITKDSRLCKKFTDSRGINSIN